MKHHRPRLLFLLAVLYLTVCLLAGCAAMVADGPVTRSGAETVAKSYPAFWRELAALGGNWEVLES